MKSFKGAGLVLAAAASFAFATGALGAAADGEHLNLSFVRFNVSDLPAMQAFYEKAFGMTVQKRLESPRFTEVILTDPKGLDLSLMHYKDGRKITLGTANGEIGFYLNDVDAVYRRALAAGAKSQSGPGGGRGIRVAIVSDPEGHRIELLHLG